MKNEIKIYALHGFLGRPSDWNFLHPQPISIDLMDQSMPVKNPWEWAHRFNHEITHHSGTLNILLGYSLGGRLALHVLLDDPSQWDGAIFISTHPGLATQEEREHRKKMDAEWALRFSTEPWNDLLEKWDKQDALINSSALPRAEEHYSRERLALALTTWSLGKQDDLRKPLQALNVPILWLAGQNDQKSASIAASLKLHHPLSVIKIIQDAGHRIPWDQPATFQQTLSHFIHKLEESKNPCTN